MAVVDVRAQHPVRVPVLAADEQVELVARDRHGAGLGFGHDVSILLIASSGMEIHVGRLRVS